MKLTAVAVSMIVLLSASGLEAWPWSGKRKLPRPLDSPIVRPKQQEHHKVGKRAGRHAAKYGQPEWGQEKSVYRIRRRDVSSWLYQD